jgi:hypothetical protein
MASNHRLIKRDSETHRLEGNRIYATVATAAKDEIRIARLKESLVCYNLAVQYAVDFDELSSAHKNCAISELEIFKLQLFTFFQITKSHKLLPFQNFYLKNNSDCTPHATPTTNNANSTWRDLSRTIYWRSRTAINA